MDTKSKKRKSKIKMSLYSGHGVRILRREVGDYKFFDIEIMTGVLIKDCKLVKGSNGYFVSTPARYSEENDTYYSHVFFSRKINEWLTKIMEKPANFKPTKLTYLNMNENEDEDEDENPKPDTEDDDEYPF